MKDTKRKTRILDSLHNCSEFCKPYNDQYGCGIVVGVVSVLMEKYASKGDQFKKALRELRDILKTGNYSTDIRRGCIPNSWLVDFTEIGINVSYPLEYAGSKTCPYKAPTDSNP